LRHGRGDISNGHIFKQHGVFHVRYYTTAIVDGQLKRCSSVSGGDPVLYPSFSHDNRRKYCADTSSLAAVRALMNARKSPCVGTPGIHAISYRAVALTVLLTADWFPAASTPKTL